MINAEIHKIVIGKRRKANPDRVKELAESIKEVGLTNAVTVTPEGKGYKLVAGLHRLEALKVLHPEDRVTFPVNVVPTEDAELVEIDENLIREDLSEIERAQCIKRRKAIFDKRYASREVGATAPKDGLKKATPGGPQTVGFDKHTADATGMSKAQVGHVRRRAEKIADDVQEAIADLPAADSGVELDALASLTADEQRQAVTRVQSGVSKTFREAKEFIIGEDEPPTQKHLTALRKAWANANNEARQLFRAEIDDFTA